MKKKQYFSQPWPSHPTFVMRRAAAKTLALNLIGLRNIFKGFEFLNQEMIKDLLKTFSSIDSSGLYGFPLRGTPTFC